MRYLFALFVILERVLVLLQFKTTYFLSFIPRHDYLHKSALFRASTYVLACVFCQGFATTGGNEKAHLKSFTHSPAGLGIIENSYTTTFVSRRAEKTVYFKVSAWL